jgi:putative ATPase
VTVTSRAPLADRMRPRNLDEIVGQETWLGPGRPIRRALDEKRLRSIILWGPPGCGKTTLARALAAGAGLPFTALSAVLDGIKELRNVLEAAEAHQRISGKPTLLFVDEIHRWNKAQQDALLPHVESGLLVLVGATTENPSFELNAALRSRLQVIRLEPLSPEQVVSVLRRALVDPRGLAHRSVTVPDETLLALARVAAGDARRALDDLERAVEAVPDGAVLGLAEVEVALQRADLRHDRSGDDHFDVVSALIKSMRGSDPDAAVYWLARMIAAGEDPTYIARRLVVFAAEDVGNADPRALLVAMAAFDAVERIGLPEGRIALAQAVTWLATCPKSNAAYLAIDRALDDVKRHGALPVPVHLRQSTGQGYKYPHDAPFRIVDQRYLPDGMDARYYEPALHGDEKLIAERLAWWRKKLGRE